MRYKVILLMVVCVIIFGCLPEKYTNPIIQKSKCIVDDRLFGIYKFYKDNGIELMIIAKSRNKNQKYRVIFYEPTKKTLDDLLHDSHADIWSYKDDEISLFVIKSLDLEKKKVPMYLHLLYYFDNDNLKLKYLKEEIAKKLINSKLLKGKIKEEGEEDIFNSTILQIEDSPENILKVLKGLNKEKDFETLISATKINNFN